MPMPAKQIAIGSRFDRWTVLEAASQRRTKAVMWLCRCDCGTTREVSGSALRGGHSTSCGRCRPKAGPVKHGMTGTPLYRKWLSMIGRCTLPSQAGYSRYGGRGIEVCARWREFENFAADMSDSFVPGLTLDRIDSDGNYEPGNCRWVTQKQQMLNTSRNRVLTWSGKSQTVAEWAEELGLNRTTLNVRLHRGWSVARALSTHTGAT